MTVEVEFRTTTLKKCYEQVQEGQRRWGERVARRYIQRVDLLYAAEDREDLYKIPSIRFHALTGDRAGECALSLDQRMRLIVTFHGKSPVIVRVEEVSKHYDD